MIDRLEYAVVLQPHKPSLHRRARREAIRNHAPRATRAEHVEDRIDQVAHRPSPLERLHYGSDQTDAEGEIIALLFPAPAKTGGHGYLAPGCRNAHQGPPELASATFWTRAMHTGGRDRAERRLAAILAADCRDPEWASNDVSRHPLIWALFENKTPLWKWGGVDRTL
jgi:hypothetical protein